jgi:hypothetical protein
MTMKNANTKMPRTFTAKEKDKLRRARTLDRPELGWIHGGCETCKTGCCKWSCRIAI